MTHMAILVRGEPTESSGVDIVAAFERPLGLIALCPVENY